MQKTKRFGLVLTPQEKSFIKRLAECEGGLSGAALVRRLIREAAQARGLWSPEDGDANIQLLGTHRNRDV